MFKFILIYSKQMFRGEAPKRRGPGTAPLVAGSKGQSPWLGSSCFEKNILKSEFILYDPDLTQFFKPVYSRFKRY